MSDRPDVQGVYDDLGEWDPTWRADGTGHLIAQASEVIGWLVDRIDTEAESLRARIEELEDALAKARHCISKHRGGCINGCWEATEVTP